MIRETLLRLDRALDEVQAVLSEIPHEEWYNFVTLQAKINDMRVLVANKLDALAASRYTAS
jgi:hypothetical protein